MAWPIEIEMNVTYLMKHCILKIILKLGRLLSYGLQKIFFGEQPQ
jgi:hypothetical protein